jgi:hypothetical protein
MYTQQIICPDQIIAGLLTKVGQIYAQLRIINKIYEA